MEHSTYFWWWYLASDYPERFFFFIDFYFTCDNPCCKVCKSRIRTASVLTVIKHFYLEYTISDLYSLVSTVIKYFYLDYTISIHSILPLVCDVDRILPVLTWQQNIIIQVVNFSVIWTFIDVAFINWCIRCFLLLPVVKTFNKI